MKLKLKIFIILVMLLVPFGVNAKEIKVEDAEKNMYDMMKSAVENNNWNVTNENQYFNIEIEIGDINNNDELKMSVEKLSNLKYSLFLLGCEDKGKCDYNHFDYIIEFSLQKDDNIIYLLAENVESKDYKMNGINKAIGYIYKKGGRVKDVLYEFDNINFYKDTSQANDSKGTVVNPEIIKKSGTIKIPKNPNSSLIIEKIKSVCGSGR